MGEYNQQFWYQPDPTDNWHERSSTLEEVDRVLRREYGLDALLAFPAEGRADQRVPSDLDGLVHRGWPSEVLDAVEQFAALLDGMEAPDAPAVFQREVNRAMREEAVPWLLLDGAFVKIDDDFMAAEVAAAEEALKRHGFAGALEELKEAQLDLTAGDVKGAIHEACKAFESALKTVLGLETGNASVLMRQLGERGFLDDLPERTRAGMAQQVLMTLPSLRNQFGGHGQGEQVIDVPRRYGDLAIGLAATMLRYCVDLHTSQA
jgi:hypothetical protein